MYVIYNTIGEVPAHTTRVGRERYQVQEIFFVPSIKAYRAKLKAEGYSNSQIRSGLVPAYIKAYRYAHGRWYKVESDLRYWEKGFRFRPVINLKRVEDETVQKYMTYWLNRHIFQSMYPAPSRDG
jgi:hypothetical protein